MTQKVDEPTSNTASVASQSRGRAVDQGSESPPPRPDATDRGADPDDASSEQATDVEIEADEEEAASEESENDLALDHVFGILKNQRRRHVLKYMRESNGQASLSEISKQIAAWENDKDPSQISSSERKRVYVGLYQCHLPKMDSMGIISFNKPRGTIELEDGVEVLYQYLDLAEENEEPSWHMYSIGMSLAGVVVLGGGLILGSLTTAAVLNAAVAVLIVAYALYALVSLNWLRTADSNDELTDEQ